MDSRPIGVFDSGVGGLTVLQRQLSVPLIGVITPEAHAAVQATRSRRVGVMATQATVQSGRYPAAITLLDAGVEVTQVACPELVPLIQRGDVHGHELHEAAKRYAAPLKAAEVDTVILGCTHYPLIRPMLQRI